MQRAERFKALDKIRAAFKDIPDEEIAQEVDKALAQVRTKKSPRTSR
jgi:hypothetical protein